LLLVADTLQRELKQKRPFRSSAQEGLISIVRTSDQLRRVLERVIERTRAAVCTDIVVDDGIRDLLAQVAYAGVHRPDCVENVFARRGLDRDLI
jgi:hypothetical protein